MNKVQLYFAIPLPLPDGPAQVITHDQITDIKIADGFLSLTRNDGQTFSYATGIIVTYTVNPHGSILTPPRP